MTLKPYTLLASSVLILGLGLPAFSAVQGFDMQRDGAVMQGADSHALILASNDDDDHKGKRRSRDHDDDDEDDDDDDCGKLGCGAGRNPAPAGSVAPPQNGLFENGTAPKVQMN